MIKAKLKNICNILNGYAFKSNNYVDDGIRIIRITNVQKGIIEDSDPKFYPNEEEKKIQKYLLNENDLLISLTGNVGRVGLLRKDLLPAALNQRVGCIRVKDKNKLNIRYLFQLLNSNTFENICISNSKGIAQKNLSTEWLKEYEFIIPNMEEQLIIAEKLENIQKIITIKQSQLCKLDELIKSLFVEMFKNVKETIKLGDCCSVHARIGWQALTKSEHMQKGEYMLITGTDFKDNEIDYSTCVYVSKERYEMDKNITLKNNDILITKDGTIGKVAIIHNLIKPATLNSGIFVVRPKRIFNKDYITYIFKGPLFAEFINKSKTGATIKHLNQKHLVEFDIPIPSIDLQNKFAEFVNQIDKQKFEIQKKKQVTY